MLIIWGKKIVRKRDGYVADYCPICRNIRTFELRRLQSVSHVYYIGLGAGETVAHEIICKECGMQMFVEREYYSEVANDDKAPVEELVAETSSDNNKRMRQRLLLAEKYSAGTLTVDERRGMLIEPFVLLNLHLVLRAKRTQFDRKSGVACIGTFVISIALCVMYGFASKATSNALVSDIFCYGIGTVAGGGAIYTLGLLLTDVRRYYHREILSKLARSLAPLKMTAAELDEIIALLKAERLDIGKRLRAPQVNAAIADVNQSSQVERVAAAAV